MRTPKSGARDDGIAELVRQYEGPLVAYVQGLVGDAERARDVVQEAFLRLVKERDRVPIDRPRPWLYRVSRNLALDVRRKEDRMAPLSDTATEAAPTKAAAPDRRLEAQETSSAIVTALGRLPDKQQEVLRLKFQGGLTYREISDVTGYSVTNVGFLMHQGLRGLQSRLAKFTIAEPNS